MAGHIMLPSYTRAMNPDIKDDDILTGATIAIGTILGYSAMAGCVGGGGLGDIAIRYGYYRYQTSIMIVTVVLLVILVQIFQSIGMFLAAKLDKRK